MYNMTKTKNLKLWVLLTTQHGSKELDWAAKHNQLDAHVDTSFDSAQFKLCWKEQTRQTPRWLHTLPCPFQFQLSTVLIDLLECQTIYSKVSFVESPQAFIFITKLKLVQLRNWKEHDNGNASMTPVELVFY